MNLAVKPAKLVQQVANKLYAVTGGRRVHVQFIAALNPFRSEQCVPDIYVPDVGSCVHDIALTLLNGVRTYREDLIEHVTVIYTLSTVRKRDCRRL